MKYLNKFLLSFSFASSTQIMITEKFPTKKNLPPKPIPDGEYLWVTGNGETIYTIATEYEKKNPVFIIKYGPNIMIGKAILNTFYQIVYKKNFFFIILLGINVYIYKYLNPYRFIYSTHGKFILYSVIILNCITMITMNVIPLLIPLLMLGIAIFNIEIMLFLTVLTIVLTIDLLKLLEFYYFKQLKETFKKARSIHNNQLENPVGLNTLSV